MEHPAVSVIIPVWNSGKYFRECLDSVLSQSLRNIEVLIVDDASTDGSGAVAEEYASRDARITVMHQPSSTGAGPARNRAMAVARGEYIAFMDSDDLYPSNDVLETLYHKAVEKHADVCGGSLYKIDDEGHIMDNMVPHQFFNYEGWYDYREYQYDGGFYRFLYNRIFLNKNGLYFADYRRFQDALFFVKTMTAAKCFYALPQYSYAYRKNHKNVIWTYEKVRDHLNGIHEMLRFSLMHHFNGLHYLMAKNLLDSINYKMNFYMRVCFIREVIKLIRCIDWNVIKDENNKNKVKVSLVKMVYRYVF